ncbi:unnamed protein product [Psylliodes chrysocephalus]|uniref:Uncharacterized protein n=1 Tax=Psylliodes chrysocephalus TaxID=3402493 RepID=A0A9P0GMP8_9CUCU|nr:unnamed protein product [Psylliodes chrysocephala]
MLEQFAVTKRIGHDWEGVETAFELYKVWLSNTNDIPHTQHPPKEDDDTNMQEDNMPLTPAEKQRQYRERKKQNPVKEAETREKALIMYLTKKKLVKDMTPREHRSAKKKLKKANKKRREQQKAVQRLMAIDTPPASPVGTPRNLSPAMRAHVLGRRKVRPDGTKLFRENQKLLTEIEKIRRQYLKYKKRYQRTKKRQSDDNNNNDK